VSEGFHDRFGQMPDAGIAQAARADRHFPAFRVEPEEYRIVPAGAASSRKMTVDVEQ
jgi:hypothetical protein